MSSAYRSERDLLPADRVQYDEARKRAAAANAIRPDHEITPEEGSLWLLRFIRIPLDEQSAMSDAERDAYYDAPATAEEKEQVRQMLAREGEWADPDPDDYPKEVILGYWPYGGEEA